MSSSMELRVSNSSHHFDVVDPHTLCTGRLRTSTPTMKLVPAAGRTLIEIKNENIWTYIHIYLSSQSSFCSKMVACICLHRIFLAKNGHLLSRSNTLVGLCQIFPYEIHFSANILYQHAAFERLQNEDEHTRRLNGVSVANIPKSWNLIA